ncbi:uncharacterized protein CELE_F36H1.11 [Caenorhabditis elegans]|uniref:Secreted protein n=1 Tax=Caenorhabditis elegans TaxID=6239 RepID=Q7YTM6_CAEEL|nr:Secreted protein [Caenorhabditis elegans]CAE17824.1 Secreted protein [Caenorhabditis elegans]|eukprot:NP_001023182.1 Uncharacterized protein CELE_F36H1.11 [Caenorhabditis elegans]
MKTAFTFIICVLFVTSIRSEESSENVHVSGSFRVAAEGEELPRSAGTQQEHPFFQLEAMKIARAYLDRQYAKEREQKADQFGA